MTESRPEDSEERAEDSTRPPDRTDAGAAEERPVEEAVEAAAGERPAEEATEVAPAAEAAGGGEADDGGEGRPPGPDRRQGGGRRGGGWVVALALLVALAAAGAAGYLGWRLYRLEQRVAAIPGERAAALEPYLRPDALQPLRARIESLEAQRVALSDRLGERVDRLAESLEAVRAITERHQIGWRLAEIRYLLSVATRRLALAYDLDGAEAALGAADDAVASLQDVRLIPLRKAIIEDLGAVRAVQPADIEGIALRLHSLLSRVDDLPRVPLGRVHDGADEDAQPADGWLQQLRDRLADFVVIQRRPGGPAPVVPPKSEAVGAADALRLALGDARRAALARHGEQYRQALERAAETLDAHFDEEAGATIRFREGLAELGRRTVETELPDLTDTLELARRLANEVEQARRRAVPDGNVEPAPGESAEPAQEG